MRNWIRGMAFGAAVAATGMAALAFSPPPKEIKVALQQDGTGAWEAAAMHALRLDEKNGIKLKIRNVADSEAAQDVLKAGRVEIILSDFIWTSRQRAEGAGFTFLPHALAAGGLMAPPGGKVTSVADLKGARLAVAEGPADGNYLILQAYYAARTEGDLTADAAVEFAAPPLVNEALAGGQADAGLNGGQFDIRAAAAGAIQIVSIPDMLKDLGVPQTPPLVGWVFPETWATENPELVKNFVQASFETKQALLTDDALWEKIRPKMKVDDDALFLALRDAYRAGIVASYTDADIDAARQTYALLARFGGEPAGEATDLAEGTFWTGYHK